MSLLQRFHITVSLPLSNYHHSRHYTISSAISQRYGFAVTADLASTSYLLQLIMITDHQGSSVIALQANVSCSILHSSSFVWPMHGNLPSSLICRRNSEPPAGPSPWAEILTQRSRLGRKAAEDFSHSSSDVFHSSFSGHLLNPGVP